MVALCFSKDVLSRFLYKIKIFNNWIKLIATTFNNLTLFHNYATYPYKNSLAESGKAIKVYFVGGSQKDSCLMWLMSERSRLATIYHMPYIYSALNGVRYLSTIILYHITMLLSTLFKHLFMQFCSHISKLFDLVLFSLDMFYSIRQYISDCNAYFSSVTKLKIRLDFDNVN